LSLISAEHRSLRALKIDGVEPTPANVGSGRYSYVKHFYLVTLTEPSAAVKRFIGFIQSADGREVLVRAGNWVP